MGKAKRGSAAKALAKKETPPKTAPSAGSAAKRTDPRAIVSLIERLRATPTEELRRAWLSQYPTTLTLAWAKKTGAAKTELEAFNWASKCADAVLNKELAAELNYSAARMVFLLETVQDVAAQRAQSRQGASSVESERSEVDSATSAARSKLARLRGRLRDVAATHDERKRQVRDALAGAVPASDLGAQIEALALLAERWIGGTDQELALLCVQGRVAERVEAARAAAERLRVSRSAVAGKGSTDKDAPEVNVAEARMLGEMAALRRAFRRAKRETGDVRYPVVTPVATAAIFAKSGRDDDDDDGEDPGGEGGEGGGGNTKGGAKK